MYGAASSQGKSNRGWGQPSDDGGNITDDDDDGDELLAALAARVSSEEDLRQGGTGKTPNRDRSKAQRSGNEPRPNSKKYGAAAREANMLQGSKETEGQVIT